MVGFQFLVILIKQNHLVVFDCDPLLSGRARQVRFMMTIELGTDNFNRVEALEGGIPRSLLVLGKQSSHVLLVSFSDFECTL